MAEHVMRRGFAGLSVGAADSALPEDGPQQHRLEPASSYITGAAFRDAPAPPLPEAVADPAPEDRVLCPTCRASNVAGTAYCWQCYARLPVSGPGSGDRPAPMTRSASGPFMGPSPPPLSAAPDGPEPPTPEHPIAAGAVPAGVPLRFAPRPHASGAPEAPTAPLGGPAPAPAPAIPPSAEPVPPLPVVPLARPLLPSPSFTRPGLPTPALDDAPTSSHAWKLGGAIGAVAVALAAGLVVLGVFRGPHVTMPQQIAGVSRLDSPPVADFENRLRQYGHARGIEAQAAIYGEAPGFPTFFVVVLSATPPEGPDRAFREFADGFAQSAGKAAAVDTTHMVQTTHDGAAFECAPGTGRLHGAICQWDDGDTVGYVMSLHGPVDETIDLSAVVRNSVES